MSNRYITLSYGDEKVYFRYTNKQNNKTLIMEFIYTEGTLERGFERCRDYISQQAKWMRHAI